LPCTAAEKGDRNTGTHNRSATCTVIPVCITLSSGKQQKYKKTAEKCTWHTNLMTPPMLLAVKLLLATGQRGEEGLRASWPEFATINTIILTPALMPVKITIKNITK